MNRIRMLGVSLLAALALAGNAATAATGAAADALIDKYSYSSLPAAGGAGKDAGGEAGGEAALVRSEDSADQKVIQDRKAERDFKYSALIALSCTMALLYLVAATMLFRLPAQQKGAQIVHLTSLALIVYGSLTLALIPTTNEGLTAPIGILGALAGYLFGHSGAARSARPDEGGNG